MISTQAPDALRVMHGNMIGRLREFGKVFSVFPFHIVLFRWMELPLIAGQGRARSRCHTRMMLIRIKDEFSQILEERNVVGYLNKLEDLIADAKRRKARSTDSEESQLIPYVHFPFNLSQLLASSLCSPSPNTSQIYTPNPNE